MGKAIFIYSLILFTLSLNLGSPKVIKNTASHQSLVFRKHKNGKNALFTMDIQNRPIYFTESQERKLKIDANNGNHLNFY